MNQSPDVGQGPSSYESQPVQMLRRASDAASVVVAGAYLVEAAKDHVDPAVVDVAGGLRDYLINNAAAAVGDFVHSDLPSQVASAAESHPVATAIFFGGPAVINGVKSALKRRRERNQH